MVGKLSSVLLTSVLPRGEPTGASALVAIDQETLDPIAVREFPPEEYLEDPELGAPGAIRHARGIVCDGDRLYATLFNGVREYTVEDARELCLRPGRFFTHPRACDLHGICVRGNVLAAASTGSDSVIIWELDSGAAKVLSLGSDSDLDVRFPDRLAREAGHSDWRDVLDVQRHVNGVSILSDGAVVVCSLTEVVEIGSGGCRQLHELSDGRMHDGCLAKEAELLLTDASRGVFLSLDMRTGFCRCIPIRDPKECFVRGIGVAGGFAYVLVSESMPSRQRDPHRDVYSEPARGGNFTISKVDLAGGQQVDERFLHLSEIARGSVAYGLVGLNS
jgi:hypothetical protein